MARPTLRHQAPGRSVPAEPFLSEHGRRPLAQAERHAALAARDRRSALTLQRLVGNRATARLITAPGIQRKLMTGLSQEIKLPPSSQLSTVAKRLHGDKRPYYLPDDGTMDLSRNEIRVLEHTKYLLGETHDNPTFRSRTALWSYVPKMLEGLKGFEEEESRASPPAPLAAPPTELPLEDMHAYALTVTVMAQQALSHLQIMLKEFPEVPPVMSLEELLGPLPVTTVGGGEPPSPIAPVPSVTGRPSPEGRFTKEVHVSAEQAEERLKELRQILRQYSLAANGLRQSFTSGRKPDKRAEHFLMLGEGIKDHRIRDQRSVLELSKSEIAERRDFLEQFAVIVRQLADTRGFLQRTFAQDPILALASALGGEADMAGALRAGNVEREAAMARRIKAAHAPLLVQMGTAHVAPLAKNLTDVVPVRLNDDFNKLTTKTE